jgi:hypothetical protein
MYRKVTNMAVSEPTWITIPEKLMHSHAHNNYLARYNLGTYHIFLLDDLLLCFKLCWICWFLNKNQWLVNFQQTLNMWLIPFLLIHTVQHKLLVSGKRQGKMYPDDVNSVFVVSQFQNQWLTSPSHQNKPTLA